MPSFKDFYRTIYDTFGYPLSTRKGLSPKVLAATEKRLGVRIPEALGDYYLVAGREHRFNSGDHSLLGPEEWKVDQRRLVFMVDSQVAVWWSVSVRNPDSEDPSVWQGYDPESFSWVLEKRRCSAFLGPLLHYKAVCGGLPFCGTADAPEKSDYILEENGWTYFGEAGGAHAYSRPGQVVCIEAFTPRFMDKMKFFVRAGARKKSGLQEIAHDLGVTFE